MSIQLALFGPPKRLPSQRSTPPSPDVPGGEAFRTQPHARLDHPEITTEHLAWIGPGGQVCTELRTAGESAEAWADRAWAIAVRWEITRAYRDGACVWDSRDPVPTEVM